MYQTRFVMGKYILSRPRAPQRAKRINVSQAKSQLSEVLRALDAGPTIIHNRGRDVGVLVSVAEYERLVEAGGEPGAATVHTFLNAIGELKASYGGGVDFSPARARFGIRNLFAAGKP